MIPPATWVESPGPKSMVTSPMNTPKIVIVGIGGPSAAGKTTIARYLFKILPNCRLLHQDDFFKTDQEIPIDEKTGLANWDVPEAIDIESFMNILNEGMNSSEFSEYISTELPEDSGKALIDEPKLSRLKSHFLDHFKKSGISWVDTRILLIDGFMLYCFPEVIKHLDVKVFIKASYETLKKRREEKVGYATAEGFWIDPPGYFDKIVWPYYLACNKHIIDPEANEEGVHGLVLFDSDTQTVYEIVKETLTLILKVISP